MKKIILFLAVSILIIACADNKHAHHDGEHDNDPHAEVVAKGSHGGKFFIKDGFGIEVTIFEPDIPPQSRVYPYLNGKQIDPSLVKLVTELHRIDRVDTINYAPQDDYLLGDIIVAEPHSFDVKVFATYQDKTYEWSYSSHEGRTEISNEAIQSTGIEIEKVQSVNIKTTLLLNGQIKPIQFSVARLTARFPGVLKEIKKFPGSLVQKGETLAVIESNESLKTYDLVSPSSGEVLAMNKAVGEVVDQSEVILSVGDLSKVWVEFSVPQRDFHLLQRGQKILLDIGEGEKAEILEGEITFLSPLADGDSQSLIARAEVANKNRLLIPELFVEAKVVIKERIVPTAVKAEAIHTFRDWDVVFQKVGQKFEIAILELGEADGDWIEVITGVTPDTEYAVKNSFVVKADVLKSGASHDH